MMNDMLSYEVKRAAPSVWFDSEEMEPVIRLKWTAAHLFTLDHSGGSEVLFLP